MQVHNKTFNIIIVDDNDDDYISIGRLLSKDPDRKYTTTNLTDGKNVILTLDSKKFDCLLIVNGADLISRIRKPKQFDLLPIIMLSGHGSKEMVAESMKSGADDFASKRNITSEWLVFAIKNILEKVDLKKRITES